MEAHSHLVPPGSGDGAVPPPSAADGVGHAFQSSFWDVRFWGAAVVSVVF